MEGYVFGLASRAGVVNLLKLDTQGASAMSSPGRTDSRRCVIRFQRITQVHINEPRSPKFEADLIYLSTGPLWPDDLPGRTAKANTSTHWRQPCRPARLLLFSSQSLQVGDDIGALPGVFDTECHVVAGRCAVRIGEPLVQRNFIPDETRLS